MNLLPGEMRRGVFTAPGVRVAGFGALDTGPVTLGVRPEDLRVGGPDQGAEGAITADVFAFEMTGDATYVTCKLGDRLVTAKAAKDHRAAAGQPVVFGVAAGRRR